MKAALTQLEAVLFERREAGSQSSPSCSSLTIGVLGYLKGPLSRVKTSHRIKAQNTYDFLESCFFFSWC